MSNFEKSFREFLIHKPFQIAHKFDFIKSLNIVGSFSECTDLTGISDIDTVIIVDHLDKWKFEALVNEFQSLSIELKSKFNFDLLINNTFGPIKFNSFSLL